MRCLEACSYFSGVFVPIYDTFGAGVVEYIVSHAEIEFIFVSEKNCRQLRDVVKAMGSKAKQIREICIWSDFSDTDETNMKAAIEVAPCC